jgi:hypothetical protein
VSGGIPGPAGRLLAALDSERRYEALAQLARELRDEGMDQVSLYRMYSRALSAADSDEDRRDAIADVLDLIRGGPWAKGRELFDEELSEERLRSE